MAQQLHLDVRLSDSLSFDNYLPARNREPVESLTSTVHMLAAGRLPIDRVIFLWGEPASGKTHLLQATCRLAQQCGDIPFVYVPLAMMRKLSPEMLEGLERVALVCIDEVERICGEPGWEHALFTLFERMRDAGGVLVLAARVNPASLDVTLRDLATRLGWGVVYHIHALNETEILRALQLRARNRGLEMPETVARYVLHRYPRDAHSLFNLLERIDEASLARQRRITIPFLRSLE
jgi:DnaA family protein